MHFFLFLGFIISVLLLLALYLIDDIKMVKRKIPKEKRFYYVKKTVFSKMIICAITLVFVSSILPFLIWTFGAKGMCEEEKILDKNNIYPISAKDKNYYLQEWSETDTKYYAVNTSKNGILINNIKEDDIQIVNIGKMEAPRYEVIGIYKINELKGNGIISNAVNDMFANIYLESIDGEKEDKNSKKQPKVIFLRKKVVIYAPEGSIKNNYNAGK